MTLFFFSGILCCLKSRNFVEDLLAHVAVVFFWFVSEKSPFFSGDGGCPITQSPDDLAEPH